MSDTLQAISRAELGRSAWNEFVDVSEDAWLWHRFELQEALATWPRHRDQSFALVDPVHGAQVLAVVPAQLVEGRLSRFTVDSLGGPALPAGIGRKHRVRLLNAARQRLQALAVECGASPVTVALPPLAPALRGERCPRVNPLLEAGFENALTQTWIAYLGDGPDRVWQRMEGRARTAVRKAEKAGVTVRPADSADDVQTYYTLHRETYERTGVNPHPKAYFESIWRDFVSPGLARVWIAELGGRAVAAENFAVYKNAAWYWTGAANATGLEAEANSLLQWQAMCWLAGAGVQWYDTGEAFPHVRGGKLKGLSDFKRGFGGELYPVFRGILRDRGWRHRLEHAATALVR